MSIDKMLYYKNINNIKIIGAFFVTNNKAMKYQSIKKNEKFGE